MNKYSAKRCFEKLGLLLKAITIYAGLHGAIYAMDPPVLVLNPHSRAGNGQGAALPGIGSANLTSKSAMAQSCAAQAPRAHTDRRRFFLQTHPARRRYVAVTICIANNYSNWH